MSFIWPIMLFSLALVPLGVLLYASLLRRRRARLRALPGGLAFAVAQRGRGPGIRRHIPPAIFLCGMAVLLVGMARPQAVVNTPRIEGTVILAFDVSGSMAADDLKPSRLEAAKAAARDFIDRQPSSVKIGVVDFSDNGFAVQMPTDDQEAILAAISRITPQRGTSVAQGIMASLNAIAVSSGEAKAPLSYSNLTPQPAPSPTPVPKGTYTSAVIVLLSDGENNEAPNPLAAAQSAADRGVRIYTVGIGSPSGTELHINGFTVVTRLDEPTLKNIAGITGGSYFNAENEKELLNIYDHLNPQLVIKPEKMELTSLFAGASILILLVGGLFSMLWFSRVP